MTLRLRPTSAPVQCPCGNTLGVLSDAVFRNTYQGQEIALYPGSRFTIKCPKCRRFSDLNVTSSGKVDD